MKTFTTHRVVIVVFALCVIIAAGVWLLGPAGETRETIVGVLLLSAVVLPVFVRRSMPLTAAVALSAGIVVSALPTLDQPRCSVVVPAALVVLFSLAVRAERPRALAGLALVLAAMVFLGYTDPILDNDGAGFAIFAFPLCGGLWGAGRLVRSRDRTVGELAELTRQLEDQRRRSAEVAVEVERTQLASDLDEAARWRIRAIIRLADDAERLLTHHPARAQEAFGNIERVGRESLNEMRGLLGVLRSDARSERPPRPSLAQIETLLDQARADGRQVELAVDGDRRSLPGGVEVAAYRALQHVLTTIQGPEEEPATVRLRYLPAALELEVRGQLSEDAAANAALAVARERVVAYGGHFDASVMHGGRRLIRARLPATARG